MKAIFTYLNVLFFGIGTCYAQNYQTLQSDEIHYFSTQTYEYYLASQIVNVDIQGTDSVFHTFKTVRENENLPEGDPCKYYLGGSWLGEKVDILSDGRNIFYNNNEEAITIETQAAINDTFLLYSYPNGDWIKATVTNVATVSILGELDQVKIYELFSNVPFPYTDNRIMLSENHGFVETFAFYNFPVPYQGVASVVGTNYYPEDYRGNFRLVGIDTTGFHKPLSTDLYDYEIGDIIKLSSSEETEDLKTVHYAEMTVINKFDWPGDSIVYFVQETIQVIEYPTGGASQTVVFGPEIKTKTVYYSKEWVTPKLPEAFNGTHGWTILITNECGDIEEISRTEGISYSGNGICLDADPTMAIIESSSINGVGYIGLNGESNGKIYNSELVYYEKSFGSSCGNNQVLNIESSVDPTSVFYPNPVVNKGVYTTTSAQMHHIIIVDKSGKVVRVWKVNGQQTIEMNFEDLDPGTYILMDENETSVQQIKIVKI